MTKHSHQHNDVVSAHERAHINSFLGNKWGTVSAREGADSRGNFDSCAICLSRAVNPVLCPQGNVYCKTCIQEFMLTQKQKQQASVEAYEKQQAEEKAVAEEVEQTKELEEVEGFQKTEEAFNTGLSSTGFPADKKRKAKQTDVPAVGYKAFKTENGSVYLVDDKFVNKATKPTEKLTDAEKEERKKFLPCFWIPTLTPDNGKVKLEKPESGLRDPFGNKLKLKKLVDIKFTPTNEAKENPKTAKDLYMCPMCRKELRNGMQLFLLRPTGDVLTKDCVELCAQEGYKGHKIRKKDVVGFRNCATSFAAGGARLVESQTQPAFTYG